MDKIQFSTNVPVELALKFAEGKECVSNFGPNQWMFSCTDERVFFVAEKVAQKIHGLRLAPGEVFEITKAEVPYSNGRKGIEWQVKRVDPPGAAQSGAGVGSPAPAVKAASQQPQATGNGNSKPNGNGNGHNGNGHNGNGHAAAAAEPPMPWAMFLLNQTRALIDVYAMACEHATRVHGGVVRNDDVRSLMLSAFINVSKNGGGNVA